METKQVLEIVLGDLSGQLDEFNTKAILEAKGEITTKLKESILLTQKAVLVHTHAYEAVVKLLAVAYKNNIKAVSSNKVMSIIEKAEALRKNLSTMRVADEFYDKLAEMEIVIYQLESYGFTKREIQHT